MRTTDYKTGACLKMTNLKQIQEKAADLIKLAAAEKISTLDKITLEIKRVQSLKCRLAKQKFKVTYDAEMREVLAQEQLLKEVRVHILPKKATVTTISQAEIDVLNHDQTIKAIKSIQSKKCNTQFLTPDKATNVEYQDACRIEQMLLAHKATVKPIAETVVTKSSINDLIALLESSQDDLDKAYIIEQLKIMTTTK
jgi:hypothetical protein